MEITTSTEIEKQPSSVTMPLLSRLDRLETAMRRLEMKQCSSPSRCSSSTVTSGLTSDHQQLPLLGLDLEMALNETSFKGTLLERIKTLENRLFQLRLRVESDKQEARSRKDQVSPSPFPVFMMNQCSAAYKKRVSTPNIRRLNNNNNNNMESQSKEDEGISSCKEDEEKEKHQKLSKKNNKKKSRKSANGDDERRERMNKKKKPMSKAEKEKIKSHNWPHLRFLGC